MEARKIKEKNSAQRQAIIDLFTQHECLEDPQGDIDNILSSRTIEAFNSLLETNQLIRENFQNELKEILGLAQGEAGSKGEAPQPDVVEAPDVVPEVEIVEKRPIDNEISDYKYLLETAREIEKIQDSFSYKHLKILELKSYIDIHPELLQQEQLKVKQVSIDLKEEIKKLRSAIEREGKMTTEIRNNLNRIDNTNDAQIIHSSIVDIMKKMMAVNIQELDSLIKKSNEAGKCISEKNGIVFIGFTGAGKSTTILSLLGHEMIQKKTPEGLPWVTPRKLLDIPGVKKVVAYPTSKSVTRNISAIKIPEDMYNSLKEGDMFFVDTAGFEDTEGSAVDLSNTYGAAGGIQSLRAGRFVLLVSGKDQGNRYQGLIRIINILNALFPVFQMVKDSIVFLFNRLEERDKNGMHAFLKEIWRNFSPTVKDNQNLKGIYFHLIDMTEDPDNIIAFDPINKKKEYAKKVLAAITKCKPNKDLISYFSVCYTERTRNDIQKQCSILKELSLYYFEEKKFKVSKYFISELEKLYELLGKSEAPEIIKSTLRAIDNRIVESINIKYTNFINSFNKLISSFSLSEENVKDYLDSIKTVDHYDIFKGSVKVPDIKQRLTENANDNIALVIETFKTSPEKIEEKTISSFKLLLKGFEKVEILRDIQNFYSKKLRQIEAEYTKDIEEGRFNQSVDSYNRYHSLYKLSCILSSLENKDAPFPLNSIVLNTIDKMLKNIQLDIENLAGCTSQKFMEIKRVANYLTHLEESLDYLRAIENRSQVREKSNSFTVNIREKVEIYYDRAYEYLNGRGNLSAQIINEISKLSSQKQQMREIPQIRMLIIEKSNTIQNVINLCLERETQYLSQFVSKIVEEKIDYHVLKKNVTRLTQAIMRIERVSEFQKSDADFYLASTYQKIYEFFEDNLRRIQEIKENIMNPDNEEIGSNMKKLGEVIEVLQAFPISSAEGEKDSGRDKPKLFKRADIVDNYNQIKENTEFIFDNNMRWINALMENTKAKVTLIQEEPLKFHSLALNGIEECLDFIKMGSQIFNLIPAKVSSFEEVLSSFRKLILLWETNLTKSIKKYFEEFRKDSDDTVLRARVRNLRRSIGSLQEVGLKYPKIKKILGNADRKFLQDELSECIYELFVECSRLLETPKENQNYGMFLLSAEKKLKIFAELDSYVEDQCSNQFHHLLNQAKEMTRSIAVSLEIRFNCAFYIGNYFQMIKNLQNIYCNQRQLYERAEAKVSTFLNTQMNSITPRRNHQIETAQEIEPIIEILDNLVPGKQALEQSKIDRNMPIFKATESIKARTELLEQTINRYYLKTIDTTQAFIAKKKLSEASACILELNKIQKLLLGSETKRDLKTQKVQELNSGISTIIAKYYDDYVKSEAIDLRTFKEDYECIFDSTINSNELMELKKAITKRVTDDMRSRIISIGETKNFNQIEYSKVKELINRLPEEFKSKSECKDLEREAQVKFQTREAQRREMNTLAEKLDIFNSGHIEPRIIEFIRDPESSTTTKESVVNKLRSILTTKIVSQDDNICNYLNQIFNCPELISPKETKNEFPVNEIIQVYTQINNKIFIKISQLAGINFSKQETILTDTDNSVNFLMSAVSFKSFISQLIKYTDLLSERFTSKDFPDTLRQNIQTKAETFISRVFNWHKVLKGKIHEMKVSINTNEEESAIASEIKKISNIKIIEDFVSEYLNEVAKIGAENVIIAAISQKIKECEGELAIPSYKKIVEENIMPKYNEYVGFSLDKNYKLMNMDDNQIEKEFKDKNILSGYLSNYLCSLLNSVGIKDGNSKVESVESQKKQLNKQSEELRQKVVQFSTNPEVQDDKIQFIRKALIVVEKYSNYHAPIVNTREVFDKHLQAYHTKMADTMMESMKALQKLEKENIAKFNESKISLEKANQQKLAERTNELNAKLAAMKAEHDLKIVGQSAEEIQKLEKTYNGEVESEKTLFDQSSKTLEKEIDQKLQKIKDQQEATVKEQFQNLSTNYQKMVSVTNTLLPTKAYFTKNREIITTMNKLGKRKWLRHLVDGLNQIGSTTAGIIILQNNQLKQLSDLHFKKNIESLTLEQVLNKLCASNSTIDSKFKLQLSRQYDSCNNQYKNLITSYQSDKSQRDSLIAELKKYVDDAKDKDKRVHLLAMIFALWTIITSVEEQSNIIFTYQPHIVQVLTAILLLGLPGLPACANFKNRFAEIQTGQGKSLILAVVSTFFALCKKEVDCVCYSQNLSQRDREAFNKLFTVLQIQSKIKYCTFNDLTESFTNNKQISLRAQSQRIINVKSNSNGIMGRMMSPFKSEYTGKVNNRVLLMDEADVFFIDEFYGNIYIPSTQLQSSTIKQLYTLIWSLRNEKNPLKTIESSSELTKVLNEFPQFNDLIRNHLPHMVSGMKNYNHEYQVMNGKIAYKNQDGYSGKISYGYKTVFAYFYEYSRKVITELPSSASAMDLSLCEISYAQLPKMYDYIVGVTGTLKNLSECKKNIMRSQYKVEENYIIPSVYKNSKRDDKGYKVVPNDKHYEEIIANLKGTLAISRRPIIIFFNNLYDVIKFYESDAYREFQKDTVILNEKHNAEERRIRIMRTMGEGKISLMTKAFARGIDFIIYQKNVITLGGGHLIVAYTIDEKSEEIQILGRVARQGDPGSSIFIITEEDLENKLGLKASQLEDKSKQNVQQILDEARQKKMSQKQQKINIQLVNCEIKHKLSIELFRNMLNNQLNTALESIKKFNQLPTIFSQQPVKTVLAIDATGSMTEALITTKVCLAQSFSRVYNILDINNVKDGFEMQIVAYRNYNVKEEQLMVITPFEITPQPLIEFIKTVEPMGGWGDEALEVVLDYCLQIEDLKQMIVITDAKINPKDHTIWKRNNTQHGYGEGYWSKTSKFSKPLDYQVLLGEIKKKNILIQSLPIGNHHLKYYENISKQTHGKCELFDPKSPDATTQLTDFISMSILSQLGGTNPDLGVKLVASYRKTYKK